MCTSIRFGTCMGRNYDYEQSYNEIVMTLPKGYDGNKYHLIGIGTGIVKNYPLMYDAMNQYGLCCSALAFTGNASYKPYDKDKRNIPSYDFVQKVVGNHKTVAEAKRNLRNVNICDKDYNDEFPSSDLHWFICDKKKSIVVEQTEDGLHIYDNPYDVLTNNPPFENQVQCMKQLDDMIGKYSYPTGEYESRGKNTQGVKGDTTSISRFSRVHYYMERMKEPKVRACYDDVETFHLLDLVKQTWGATPVNDSYEYTIYSAVYDMENLELSVKTYDHTRVHRFVLTNRSRRYRI